MKNNGILRGIGKYMKIDNLPEVFTAALPVLKKINERGVPVLAVNTKAYGI